MFYEMIRVGNEEIGLVWDVDSGRTRIRKIYLPAAGRTLRKKIVGDFPGLNARPKQMPGGIGKKIAALYLGRPVSFDASVLDWSQLSAFARKVLKKTYGISRGRVMTYSALAAAVGTPKAARAVGTAMANNPFPIVIPCHRVIRADGSLGQFGGGVSMKKTLLEREGVPADASGTVSENVILRKGDSV